MMLLKVNSLTKYMGARKVLNNINLTINKGQRVGLLGLNGCGKSTLFKLIEGKYNPDRGEIIIPRNTKTGYLPQGFCDLHQLPDITVKEFLMEPLKACLGRMKYLENMMEKNGDKRETEKIITEYGDITSKFERLGGYLYEEKLPGIFKKIHIDDISSDSEMTFLKLSGGQRLKVALARILAGDPDLLLLDEPTNYLDIPSLIWLENFLLAFKGGTIVISHDRKFLDRFAREILEISILDGTLTSYSGNYSFYRREKDREIEKHWQRYREQQEKILQLKGDIISTKNQALKTEENTVNDKLRGYAKKVAKKAKAREKRLERLISEEKKIEKPRILETVRILLKSDLKKGKALITARNIDFTLPEGRNLFRGVDFKLSCGDKIVIMGPNGSGKSTFMKILAGKIMPSCGNITVWPGTERGYLPQDEGEELDLEKTVFEEFRKGIFMEEGEARTFLHRMLFKGEDVFKKLRNLSYGERIKLLLAKLMASGMNTLLLDEPTGHLDIDTVERLEKALLEFTGGLVVITHDRYFIEKINIQNIYILYEGEMLHYNSYKDYERTVANKFV